MSLLHQLLSSFAPKLKEESVFDLARLLAKVEVDSESGCWVWTARRDADNRGTFKLEGRPVLAYRASYVLLAGPIPAGLELDHLCRNPPCVNPHHLEPVTGEENRRRHRAAAASFDTAIPVTAHAIAVLVRAGVDRMHTTDLLDALAAYNPAFASWDGNRLSLELQAAGARRNATQVKVNGVNRNGWRLSDLLNVPLQSSRKEK